MNTYADRAKPTAPQTTPSHKEVQSTSERQSAHADAATESESSPSVAALERTRASLSNGSAAQRIAHWKAVLNRASPATSAAPVQRRVHRFKNSAWTPGENKREGTKPFPINAAEGDRFNDVNGRHAASLKDVVDTLDEMVAQTGRLEDIASKTTWTEWDQLGSALKTEFKKEADNSLILEQWRVIKNNPNETKERREQAAGILKTHFDPEVPLGRIWFDHDKDWAWTEKLSETRVDHGKIAAFLRAFMAANGQVGYIRRQSWFKSGHYGIEIEVNYYPHRGFEAAAGGYHKDTGGNNIFVNIIFHNDDPIPATELFKDAAPRSTRRRELQKQLLPIEHRQRLHQVRANIRKDDPKRDKPIQGGVVGRHGYASWVDDLAWHATPDLNVRPSVERDELLQHYALNKKFDASGYHWPYVIRALAEISGTAAAKHLRRRKLKLKELTGAQWEQVWNATYGAGDETKALSADLSKLPDAKLRFNRFRAHVAEAIARDDKLPLDRTGKAIPGQKIDEQPVGLVTRRRANSDAAERQRVQAAQAQQAGKTRSFIRTWVKIVRISKPPDVKTTASDAKAKTSS